MNVTITPMERKTLAITFRANITPDTVEQFQADHLTADTHFTGTVEPEAEDLGTNAYLFALKTTPLKRNPALEFSLAYPFTDASIAQACRKCIVEDATRFNVAIELASKAANFINHALRPTLRGHFDHVFHAGREHWLKNEFALFADAREDALNAALASAWQRVTEMLAGSDVREVLSVAAPDAMPDCDNVDSVARLKLTIPGQRWLTAYAYYELDRALRWDDGPSTEMTSDHYMSAAPQELKEWFLALWQHERYARFQKSVVIGPDGMEVPLGLLGSFGLPAKTVVNMMRTAGMFIGLTKDGARAVLQHALKPFILQEKSVQQRSSHDMFSVDFKSWQTVHGNDDAFYVPVLPEHDRVFIGNIIADIAAFRRRAVYQQRKVMPPGMDVTVHPIGKKQLTLGYSVTITPDTLERFQLEHLTPDDYFTGEITVDPDTIGQEAYLAALKITPLKMMVRPGLITKNKAPLRQTQLIPLWFSLAYPYTEANIADACKRCLLDDAQRFKAANDMSEKAARFVTEILRPADYFPGDEVAPEPSPEWESKDYMAAADNLERSLNTHIKDAWLEAGIRLKDSEFKEVLACVRFDEIPDHRTLRKTAQLHFELPDYDFYKGHAYFHFYKAVIGPMDLRTFLDLDELRTGPLVFNLFHGEILDKITYQVETILALRHRAEIMRKEGEEAAIAEWIDQHGSDTLKKILAEGINVTKAYRAERKKLIENKVAEVLAKATGFGIWTSLVLDDTDSLTFKVKDVVSPPDWLITALDLLRTWGLKEWHWKLNYIDAKNCAGPVLTLLSPAPKIPDLHFKLTNNRASKSLDRTA